MWQIDFRLDFATIVVSQRERGGESDAMKVSTSEYFERRVSGDSYIVGRLECDKWIFKKVQTP